MRNPKKKENYEVGYGKPPKSGEFQPGVSGNPSGRPKKPSDFGAKLLRELNSPLTIKEGGKVKVITKDEAIAKQLVNKATNGHVPSMRLLDKLRGPAIEKAAEHLRLANRTVDELTDEELIAIIRAEQAELEKSGPDGADGRKPGDRRRVGER